MIAPKRPANELKRLQDLYHYEIMDTEVEEEFDMLVELASRICDTPISTITLVDEERQWFKAKVGLEVAQTSRDVSFCGHAILQNDLMVVNDATKDNRFMGNPLVTGAPSIRFYAGAQIRSASGHKLGTLCVIDDKPRELGWHQASSLRILATQASRLMELRYLKTHIQRLGPEKEALRRQNALGELSSQQAAYFTAKEETLLEPLKTGRFTKKDLGSIYQYSKSLLQANKRFATILALYHKEDLAAVETGHESVSFNSWLMDFSKTLRGNGYNQLQVRQLTTIPKEVQLHTVRIELLQHLFEIIALDLSVPLAIEAIQEEDKVQIRCHFTGLHLEEYVTPETWKVAADHPIAGMGAYNLRLLSWVIMNNGCSFKVAPDSCGNSCLTITLPHPGKTE